MYRFSIRSVSLSLIALFLIFSPSTSAQFDEDFLVTNNAIYDMVRDNDNLYIGGYFNYVGPNTGKGVLLDYGTAAYNPSFPKVNGNVYVCISDNNGGWFIGGSFSKVGSFTRNNIAHITSSGEVSSWNPGTNGTVRALHLNGSTLYVGGYFTNIGGAGRNYAGAVDANTGIPTAWDPDPNGGIWAITSDGSNVYIGGSFSFVNVNTGQQQRNSLAKVTATTGTVTSWICDVTPASATLPFVVYGLQLDGSTTLYVWGNINSIGGVTRRGVGRVNTASSNSVQTWNPNVLRTSSATIAGTVYSVHVTAGDTVFIGGLFSRIRTTGTIRNNIASVTKSGTPTVHSWNPNIYADWNDPSWYRPQVNSIQVRGGSVYAGGRFNLVGGNRRHNLAEISRSTGDLTSWDPHVSDSYFNGGGEVYTLLVDDKGLFAGGEFPSVNGKTRKGVAKIDLQTKTLSNWDPQLENWDGIPQVRKLAVHNSTVFVGGSFDSVGGQYQKSFAAIDKNTGQLQSFLPFENITTPISLLKVKDSKLYISGNFTAVGDSARNRAACIDLTNLQVTAWDPQLSGGHFYELIHSMAFSDSTIFIGGDFTAVRGVSRGGLAAVDYNLGLPTSWNPNSGNPNPIYPSDLEVNNSLVYISGAFTQVGTTSRNRLAAVDFNGNITPWNPNVQNGISVTRVNDIEIVGDNLYLGGDFSLVNGIPRINIASINKNTGNPNTWYPEPIGEVYKVLVDQANQTVYFGGGFGNVDNNTNFGLAKYLDPSLVTAKTLNLTALIEGFYDGSNMVSDTVTVELRNSLAPYALVESKNIVLDNLGQGSGTFNSAVDGTNYYIVVKHRNSIETWSKTPQSFTGGTLTYDFTTAANKAYGDNLKFKFGKWCIYSGDVSDGVSAGVQDGFINIFDNFEVYNDSYAATYRLLTDLNLDGVVDIFDDLYGYNNSYIGVTAIYPGFPRPGYLKKETNESKIDIKIVE